ncbi:MAG: hypothetical protein ABRQ24_08120 [Syntrophomonadaceae bacterium]
MKESLNIYKEGDKIIIDDDLTYAELPYTDELWRKLDGEQTYDEDLGWLIDGIELSIILEEETDKEMESVFIGTIQADGIDDRRELYVVGEGDVYKIVVVDAGEDPVDTEIISESLREAVVRSTEIWSDDESDLQLSEEAEALLEDLEELDK